MISGPQEKDYRYRVRATWIVAPLFVAAFLGSWWSYAHLPPWPGLLFGIVLFTLAFVVALWLVNKSSPKKIKNLQDIE